MRFLRTTRLRLHDHQYLSPPCPQSPKRQEKQPIPLTQVWSGILALEHAYLAAQGDKLNPKIMSSPEKRRKLTEETQEEATHGRVYTTECNDRSGSVDNSLIPWTDQILATYRSGQGKTIQSRTNSVGRF
jgi:hypothetical protein